MTDTDKAFAGSIRDKSRLDEAPDTAAEAVAKRFGRGPVDGKLRVHVVEAAR